MMKELKNEKPFVSAYNEYKGGLLRHCSFRVSEPEKARDITEETFTRVWQFMSTGHKIKNMKAYLYRIANNMVIDYYRKKKEISLDHLQESGFDVGFDDTEHLENFIAGKGVMDMLGSIGEDYHNIIVMRYVKDLPISDIATLTGLSENAVSVRLHRALKKLRDLFERA